MCLEESQEGVVGGKREVVDDDEVDDGSLGTNSQRNNVLDSFEQGHNCRITPFDDC